MKYVKITKIGVADNYKVESATWEQYAVGKENSMSLPVEYQVEGFLLKDIVVGHSIRVDRRYRNGDKVNGVFISSAVESFDGKVATTQNSQYLVEEIEEP